MKVVIEKFFCKLQKYVYLYIYILGQFFLISYLCVINVVSEFINVILFRQVNDKCYLFKFQLFFFVVSWGQLIYVKYLVNVSLYVCLININRYDSLVVQQILEFIFS